ncbi:MAG: hypothetical protein BAJATHORv1_10597 [Candidatus Thorarchaeota archaeon]|nr:MAG: hypothetical protein BAJATHORv1_10597 [Candidatus Thorarchaeota archaeon]
MLEYATTELGNRLTAIMRTRPRIMVLPFNDFIIYGKCSVTIKYYENSIALDFYLPF